MKIKPCCLCGGIYVNIWRSMQSRKKFVACEICHACGKSRLTRRGAIRAWNREKRPRKILIGGRDGNAQAD